MLSFQPKTDFYTGILYVTSIEIGAPVPAVPGDRLNQQPVFGGLLIPVDVDIQLARETQIQTEVQTVLKFPISHSR